MRGYIHQIAFFIALGACSVLVIQSQKGPAYLASIIYSLSLVGLYGVSALYHRTAWSRHYYLLMKRIDHAAIFVLIAGSITPFCLLALNNKSGWQLLLIIWLIAIIGIIRSLCWNHGSKGFRAILYVIMGWLVIPYLPEMKVSLDSADIHLLIGGGIIYTLGALIYAFKYPDPCPRVFGYHEIFHIFVVIASCFHFKVIYDLATTSFY